MRVSFSNIAWDPALDDDVGCILRDHGIDAVDVAPGKYVSVPDATTAELVAVREAWRRRGCEIVGMQSLLFGTNGLELFGTAEAREQMFTRLSQVCRVGARLGATRLVFGSPRNRDVHDRSTAEVGEISTDFLGRLGDVATKYDVRILLEPNPPAYGATYLTTTSEAADVVRALGHPAIGLQLDLGAVAMNDEDPGSLVTSYGDLVGHVHVSQPQLAPVAASAFLDAAAPVIRQALPTKIACIEMLTGHDVLGEVRTAAAYTSSVFVEQGAAS